MNDIILDSANLVEDGILDDEESSDLTATKNKDHDTMDFHIQMHGYTMVDFETMVVEAAAQQLLRGHSEDSLKKKIEERLITLVSGSIDKALEPITKEIMDDPMLPKYRGAKSEAMTLREYIGLCGRDFLQTKVDNNGNITTGTYHGESRINRLIAGVLDRGFEKEIKSSTSELKTELRSIASAKMNALIDEERNRITEALGYEVKRSR